MANAKESQIMPKDFKILFFGDIVGRPGRKAITKYLSDNKERFSDCFVIANVENASHGFGLTKKNHDELMVCGINCMTSGNHIWDKKDVYTYMAESNVLIRPLNYHKTAQGVGYRVFDEKLIVINMMGKTFMPPANCPFAQIEEFFCEMSKETELSDKIIVIDFHAEATAEKICFAKYAANLGAKAVLGTHTHVQTADERIIDSKCAFITDIGFCGAQDSVIGMDYEVSLKRLITSIPERFDVAISDSVQINACEVIFDYATGVAKSIERITNSEVIESEN